MHQRRASTHRPPPERDAREAAGAAEVVDDTTQVVALVKAQRDIVAAAHASASEVEADQCDVHRQQVGHEREAAELAAAVAVAEDDAGAVRPRHALFLRSPLLHRLEERADQLEAALVGKVQLRPLDIVPAPQTEAVGRKVFHELQAGVALARGADEQVPDREDVGGEWEVSIGIFLAEAKHRCRNEMQQLAGAGGGGVAEGRHLGGRRRA
mmetsp:Transcript_67965/g.145496  ORF Transcript_67965/g.145496 Transcript_67965/m.145496 type:complete len:211 (+) Transcript_67965:577-1209(+)